MWSSIVCSNYLLVYYGGRSEKQGGVKFTNECVYGHSNILLNKGGKGLNLVQSASLANDAKVRKKVDDIRTTIYFYTVVVSLLRRGRTKKTKKDCSRKGRLIL